MSGAQAQGILTVFREQGVDSMGQNGERPFSALTPHEYLESLLIEARSLTKRYGSKTAVGSIDFTVRPGLVTGFLGPNGAGK